MCSDLDSTATFQFDRMNSVFDYNNDRLFFLYIHLMSGLLRTFKSSIDILAKHPCKKCVDLRILFFFL